MDSLHAYTERRERYFARVIRKFACSMAVNRLTPFTCSHIRIVRHLDERAWENGTCMSPCSHRRSLSRCSRPCPTYGDT